MQAQEKGRKRYLGSLKYDRCEQRPAVMQLERLAEDEARAVEYELGKDLRSFGKGFTVLEQVR